MAFIEQLHRFGTLDQRFFEGMPVGEFPPAVVLHQARHIGIMGNEQVRNPEFAEPPAEGRHRWIEGAVKDRAIKLQAARSEVAVELSREVETETAAARVVHDFHAGRGGPPVVAQGKDGGSPRLTAVQGLHQAGPIGGSAVAARILGQKMQHLHGEGFRLARNHSAVNRAADSPSTGSSPHTCRVGSMSHRSS